MSDMNSESTVQPTNSQQVDTQPPLAQSLDVLSSTAVAPELPSPIATPEPTLSAPTAVSQPVSSDAATQPVPEAIPSIESPMNNSPPADITSSLPAQTSAPPTDDLVISSTSTQPVAGQDTLMTENVRIAAPSAAVPSQPNPAPESADVAQVPSKPDGALPTTSESAAPTSIQPIFGTSEETIASPGQPQNSSDVNMINAPAGMTSEASSASAIVDSKSDLSQTMAPSVTTNTADSSIDTHAADIAQANRTRTAEDALDEPSAKRTKIEETSSTSAEFKKPDLPITTQSLPPIVTTTTGIAAPVNTAATAAPRFSSEPLTHVQKKILEDKIKNTKKTKHALPFLRPVDPIALGIPNYPTIITQPMDISTLEQKLKAGQYASLDAFVNDFELIVSNCFKFNGENHDISRNARNLREYFMKQLETVPTGNNASTPVTAAPQPRTAAANVKTQPRRESRVSVSGTPTDAFPLREPGVPQIRRDSTVARPQRAVVTPSALRDLSYSIQPKKKSNQAGLKFCDHVLSELEKTKYVNLTSPFMYPVDPIALKIPQYNKIIKEPMDISSIGDKQQKGYYSTAEEFKADWDLMFANCFKFNPPGHPVHDCGVKLEHEFKELWKDKSKWTKAHGPQSQRESPVSDDEDEDDDDEEEEENDPHETQLALLKSQLANMQSSMQSLISGITDLEARKKASKSAGADGKKKKRKSQTNGGKSAGGAGNTKGKGNSGAKSKAKSSKPRKITRDQAKYITDMSENMSEEQVNKLTELITKDYTPVGDEVEIDELPAEIQQRVFTWVKSLFGPPPGEEDDDDGYDGEQRSRKASGAAGPKKKRKPMKADEQMRKAAELQNKMDALQKGQAAAAGGMRASATPTAGMDDQSSGGESDESSEEE